MNSLCERGFPQLLTPMPIISKNICCITMNFGKRSWRMKLATWTSRICSVQPNRKSLSPLIRVLFADLNMEWMHTHWCHHRSRTVSAWCKTCWPNCLSVQVCYWTHMQGCNLRQTLHSLIWSLVCSCLGKETHIRHGSTFRRGETLCGTVDEHFKQS